MKSFVGAVLILLVGSVKGQFAAWPATSYSPFFDAMFKAATSPVAAMPSGPGFQGPALPIQAPVFASPMFAPSAIVPAPIPGAPAVAAAPPLAPSYVPAAPTSFVTAYAPTIFAPSAGYFVPKAIPAPYGPFGRPAVAYGSNKEKKN